MTQPSDVLHDFPDRALRDLLKDPRNLHELFQLIIPALVERFDWTAMSPVGRDFLLEDWRGRESDLLCTIPFHSAADAIPVLVCLLLEHQSQPDSRMPLRLLLYAVLYWERQWHLWEQLPTPRPPLRLHSILPIVFHTGPYRWTIGKHLADLIGGPEELRGFVPAWNVLFWDLVEKSSGELLLAPGAFARALAVVREDGADAATFLRVSQEVEASLEPLAAEDRMRWRQLFHFVLSWGLQRRQEQECAALITAAQESQQAVPLKQEAEIMGRTIAEALRDEGQKIGEKQGRLATLREVLRIQLEERFGSVPEELVQRIEKCENLDLLRAVVKAFPHMQSLAELPPLE